MSNTNSREEDEGGAETTPHGPWGHMSCLPPRLARYWLSTCLARYWLPACLTRYRLVSWLAGWLAGWHSDLPHLFAVRKITHIARPQVIGKPN